MRKFRNYDILSGLMSDKDKVWKAHKSHTEIDHSFLNLTVIMIVWSSMS